MLGNVIMPLAKQPAGAIKLSRRLLPGNNYPDLLLLYSETFTNILIDANVGTIFTTSLVWNEIRNKKTAQCEIAFLFKSNIFIEPTLASLLLAVSLFDNQLVISGSKKREQSDEQCSGI